MAVHALEAVVESSEELTRRERPFSCLLGEEQGDRLFEKGLQYCSDFFFKAKCLNYLVSFINFTLAGT